MSETSNLGALLRARREALGLTMAEVAEASQATLGAVYRWEHGTRHPHANSMKRLAGALLLPYETLRAAPRGGVDETTPKEAVA